MLTTAAVRTHTTIERYTVRNSTLLLPPISFTVDGLNRGGTSTCKDSDLCFNISILTRQSTISLECIGGYKWRCRWLGVRVALVR